MYFDPGTGSIIIQLIVGFIAGFGAFFVAFRTKIKSFFTRKKHNKNDKRK